MNSQGRALIANYMGNLEQIQQDLVSLADDEQQKFDSLPEGFQKAQMGLDMEQAIDSMNEAVGFIAECLTSLEGLTNEK